MFRCLFPKAIPYRKATTHIADALLALATPRSDNGPMTTVTCKNSHYSFPTEARTNTRCRRCRTVVQVGRSEGRSQITGSRGGTANEPAGRPVAVTNGPVGIPVGLLGLPLGGAGVAPLWHGFRLEPADGADSEAVKRTRLWWYVIGGVLVAAGAVVVMRAV